MTSASRARLPVAFAAGLVLVLSGCVDAPPPAPTPTPTPTATEEPIPELRPDGSALQNLDYFRMVLRDAREDGARDGRDFLDALVEAGFDRDAMEVTADTTTVGLDADNIQFSVLINGTCLVGQYGNVGLRSAALPRLASDRCLVGATASAG